MNNLMISLEVIFPLATWMALGYLLRSALGLNENWVKTTTAFAFRVLMPLLLFRNMVESDFAIVFSGEMARLIAFILAAYGAMYTLAMVLTPRLVKEPSRKGVIVQGIVRANTAIFGIPIAMSLFGDGNIGIVGLMVGMMVPVFNISCVIALEVFRGGKPKWKHILSNVAKNPLIIGITTGILWNVLRIPMPNMLRDAIWKLSACTSPLSFFVLGAGFTFAGAVANKKALTVVTILRLVIIPGIWIGLGALVGFRGLELLCIMIIFAPPTAITSYSMACAMGGDPELSNGIVVFTSTLSVVTVFGWVWLLKSSALI